MYVHVCTIARLYNIEHACTIFEVVSELFLPEPVGVVSQTGPRLHQQVEDVNVVDGVQNQSLQFQFQNHIRLEWGHREQYYYST